MTREEAISHIKSIRKKISEPTETQLGWLETWIDTKDIEALDIAIRALEQESKVGHWIPSHIPESILDECSECGFSCGAFTFNYCPNCGVKMESGVEQ